MLYKPIGICLVPILFNNKKNGQNNKLKNKNEGLTFPIPLPGILPLFPLL